MSRRRPIDAHARRRRRLARRLGGGVVVVGTAPVAVYSNDVDYPFRPDSDFFYLTGFTESHAVAILTPGHPQATYRLFVRPRLPEREVWDGPRAGLEEAVSVHGADVAGPLDDLESELESLLTRSPVLHRVRGGDAGLDRLLRRVCRRVGRGRRRKVEIHDLEVELRGMRVRKDDDEVRLMEKAARITCAAHRVAMARTVPGAFEYEIQAEIEYEFRRRGATGPAYPSIVGSGPNACTLHHIENRRRMRARDLLLIDAGCELGGYAADVTRTFPVSGRFGRAQREIYELVLAAQQAAIAAVSPRRPFDAPHRAALEVLAEGMSALALLDGDAAEIIGSGSYRRYFMHRTSHWLGLDVHDAGPRTEKGKSPRLRPGMVLTVEPGLYIPPGDRTVPTAYRGLGVRIEDDVLVTASGHRVLTASAPKSPEAVERLVGTAPARRGGAGGTERRRP